MKKQLNYDVDSNIFAANQEGCVLIIKIKNDFLLRTADLSVRDYLLEYFDLVEKEKNIRVIVIQGALENKGCEEYFEFYNKILKNEWGQPAILRMFNVINQLILKIVHLNKIVVHGNSGKIISPFLNLSLASDYRIMADNSILQNPCLDLGLVPKGGGPYFLTKMIGAGKALDFLLSGKNITAFEALEIGIVNEVVREEDLESALLKKALFFAEKPLTSSIGIKKLLNFQYRDLKEYLDFENEELTRIISKSECWTYLADRSMN